AHPQVQRPDLWQTKRPYHITDLDSAGIPAKRQEALTGSIITPKLRIPNTLPLHILKRLQLQIRQLASGSHAQETGLIPELALAPPQHFRQRLSPPCRSRDFLVPLVPDDGGLRCETLVLDLAAVREADDLVDVGRRRVDSRARVVAGRPR